MGEAPKPKFVELWINGFFLEAIEVLFFLFLYDVDISTVLVVVYAIEYALNLSSAALQYLEGLFSIDFYYLIVFVLPVDQITQDLQASLV